jgi:hypothetical protein
MPAAEQPVKEAFRTGLMQPAELVVYFCATAAFSLATPERLAVFDSRQTRMTDKRSQFGLLLLRRTDMVRPDVCDAGL